jgi:hypothetical protein
MEKDFFYLQQGDVMLKKAVIPSDAVTINDPILAKGEVTGHAHRLYDELGYTTRHTPQDPIRKEVKSQNFEVLKKGNVLYLRVKEPVMLQHEEHDKVEVPPGDFLVDIVKEYNHFDEESKRVAD